ncbi:hypothetical protein OL230_05835 [Capnocytophaga ochracea]|uniref:hypothetical protein n=1 Tax=Capnocytophaga ochracea TaxID=1018 RepID=UPI00222E4258|nr:hypothetical protein [Capnocytophaga ochracea]UZD39682.1 hypothetical protein OL230_05835 [Capnocytophaga ochracea]
MKLYLYFSFILVNILNAQEKNKQSYIYEGKSFPFVVYFDNEKQEKIVEVLGIKYGKLDFINNMKTKEGYIYTKNNDFYYKNDVLKINTRLTKKNYSNKIEATRYKIFSINALNEITSLQDSLGIDDYNFDWNVKEDFIYYRNNSIDYSKYTPNYIKKFYEYLKDNKK